MDSFVLNGILWRIIFVDPVDYRLVDRTGELTLGTTDPVSRTVCISQALSGQLLERVLVHEICHCAMVSYGLLNDIHKVVYPECWIYAEEWVCNLMAEYGLIILDIAHKILGRRAIHMVPVKLEEILRG